MIIHHWLGIVVFVALMAVSGLNIGVGAALISAKNRSGAFNFAVAGFALAAAIINFCAAVSP